VSLLNSFEVSREKLKETKRKKKKNAIKESGPYVLGRPNTYGSNT
jgi:hypothetical protein